VRSQKQHRHDDQQTVDCRRNEISSILLRVRVHLTYIARRALVFFRTDWRVRQSKTFARYHIIEAVKMSTETAAVPQVAAAGDAKQKVPARKKVASGKSSAVKKAVDHPKYSEMVQQALTNLKERGGSSRQAVLKYIMKNFNVGADETIVNTHLKMALKSGVKNASLKQSKGSGAAGSFRIGEVKKPKLATKSKKPKAVASKSVAKKAKSIKSPAKKAAGKKPSMQKKVKAAAGGEKKVKKPAATATGVKRVQKPKAVQKAKKASSPVKKSAKPTAAKKTPVKSVAPKKAGAAKKV
jgi:hypothetical protein